MSLAGVVQRIGGVPLLSTAMRRLAHVYREGSIVTIRTGLAKGYKWRRHHRYVNGYWIGHYELDIQQALRRELSSGDTFFDVGANAGFFTLVASRLVGPRGKCVAFDPSPENVASIREQVELNGLADLCTVAQQAVGAAEGRASFAFDAPGSSQGHLGASSGRESALQVEVTTLDAAARRFGMPSFVKLDVEGAEVDVLRGAGDVIDAAPIWLIEVHGVDRERGVREILRGAGYRFFGMDGSTIPLGERLPHHVIARRDRKSG